MDLGNATQIACFSVSNGIVSANSTTSLQYFKEPPRKFGVPLTHGCDGFFRRYKSDRTLFRPRPLDNIFAVLNEENKDVFRNANVLTWRGIVVKIMLGTKISLNMSFIDGTLYLDEDDPEPNRPKFNRSSYPGQAFESLCTRDTPDEVEEDNNTSLTRMRNSNPRNLWCSIVSRQLGPLQLLLAGEVDCVKGRYTGTPDSFLELKTQRINANGSKRGSTYKKWYWQSRMLGVSEIFLGHRDSNEVLCETEWIKVDDLPARVKGWDPQTSIDKGARILEALRAFCCAQNAVEGDDYRVWRVVCGNSSAVNGMVTVTSGAHVRELSLEERDIISHRGGVERVGIITKHAVQKLRS